MQDDINTPPPNTPEGSPWPTVPGPPQVAVPVNQTPQFTPIDRSNYPPAPVASPTIPPQAPTPVVNPVVVQQQAAYNPPLQGSQPQPVSRSGFEQAAEKGRKTKLLTILIVCAAVIILGVVGWSYFSYSSQDHSIYSKLTTAKYTQNGNNISFSYPAVMTPFNDNSSAAVLAYAYSDSSGEKAVVGLGAPIAYGSVLQNLGISSTQVVTQLVTHSGSFVDALNKASPGNFNNLYGNCHSYVHADNGQTAALCVSTQSDFTVARVIGENNISQYSLSLTIPNSLWTAHQQVWQKVEKSFSY